MINVAKNIEQINLDITQWCQKYGRDPSSVSLMAVSKTKPVEQIIEAYNYGQRLFGENRVLEAHDKFYSSDFDCEVHMIGHLQSNKISKAIECFDVIDSIDSIKTATKLSKRLVDSGKEMKIYLEYNCYGEVAKSGFKSRDEISFALDEILKLPAITVDGYMTVAPYLNDEKILRTCFSDLYEIKEKIDTEFSIKTNNLSMGMSNDYEYAIAEGATIIRIGTAIFGDRQ